MKEGAEAVAGSRDQMEISTKPSQPLAACGSHATRWRPKSCPDKSNDLSSPQTNKQINKYYYYYYLSHVK